MKHILPDVAEKDIIGIAAHPHRAGYLCTWGMDSQVGLLRP